MDHVTRATPDVRPTSEQVDAVTPTSGVEIVARVQQMLVALATAAFGHSLLTVASKAYCAGGIDADRGGYSFWYPFPFGSVSSNIMPMPGTS